MLLSITPSPSWWSFCFIKTHTHQHLSNPKTINNFKLLTLKLTLNLPMPSRGSNYEMPTPLVHLMRFVELTLTPLKALHMDEKSETHLGRVSSINLWTSAQGSRHPISMCMPLLIPTHHLNTCPTLVKTSVGHSRYQKPWTWNSPQIAFSDSHSNQNMKASTWKQKGDQKWGVKKWQEMGI